MIVEDEPMIAISLCEEFKDAGHEVAGPFATCAEALQSLEISLPDVAVLDTVLKDGSCLELARDLRRRGVPFLIFSGKSAHWDEPPEFENVPWIEKPAPFDEVLSAVTE